MFSILITITLALTVSRHICLYDFLYTLESYVHVYTSLTVHVIGSSNIVGTLQSI